MLLPHSELNFVNELQYCVKLLTMKDEYKLQLDINKNNIMIINYLQYLKKLNSDGILSQIK